MDKIMPCPLSIELSVLLDSTSVLEIGSHIWKSVVIFYLLARYLLASRDSGIGEYLLLLIVQGVRCAYDPSVVILAETLHALDGIKRNPTNDSCEVLYICSYVLCFA